MGPLATHKHPNGPPWNKDDPPNTIRGREVRHKDNDIVEEGDMVNEVKGHTWKPVPTTWIGNPPSVESYKRWLIIRPE